jgi:periplasmic divalent cation tolerance protein
LITAKDKSEAEFIAKSLLNERLIACANIIGGIESSYWWKGKIEQAEETLVIIKTTAKNAKKVVEKTKHLHSYEVPEIVFFKATAGNKDFLKWVEKETKAK